MKTNSWVLPVVLIVAILATFIAGYFVGRKPSSPLPVPSGPDTIFVHDTLIERLPAPSEVRQLHDSIAYLLCLLDEKPDTIVRDSAVFIYLPREQRRYTSPSYDAWVSGVDPRLDSIMVFAEKEIIHVPVPSADPKAWRLKVASGASLKGGILSPFVSASLNWRNNRFELGATVGYSDAPFVGARISYDILRW